jgi:hypothetical protein
MPESPSTAAPRAGCSTPVTPISTATRSAAAIASALLGLRAYQTMMEVDRERRLANQARLRALSVDRAAEVKLVCAHDAAELEACAAGRPL